MRILTLFIYFFVITGCAQAEDSPRIWEPKISLLTKIISDVQVSPDNKSILFVSGEAETERNCWTPKIYLGSIASTSARLLLEEPCACQQPRWSPDGKWIAYICCSEKVHNLHLFCVENKKDIALTAGTKNVQTFAWSPDGKTIAFVMEDATHLTTKKTSSFAYKEKKNVNRLWTIDVFRAGAAPIPSTSDDYCVRGFGDLGAMEVEFDWSPDGKKIAFAYSPNLGFDSFILDSSIAILDVTTGAITPWEKNNVFEASPKYSPDGQYIAYVTDSPSRRYGGSKRLAIRFADGTNKRLLAHTLNESPLLLGWNKDADKLIVCEAKRTKHHLCYVHKDGSASEEILTGDVYFRPPSLSYDRKALGLVIQSTDSPPEAFISSLDHFAPIQISDLNKQLLTCHVAKTDVITWRSTDGLKIEGLLTYPVGYEHGKQYPLLVIVHGGPTSFFSETFIGNADPHSVAAFAQAGFAILRPNPRGSSSYGYNFRHGNQQDFGGMDFIDIISGVDFLVEQAIADPEKLGIMGWSYGGYMAAWAATQSSRFKAASIGAAITNLVSLNGTTDLHHYLTSYLGEFTENKALYEERSPLYHVNNISIPCLIQHGEIDSRVPISQAYELYHAMQRLGKEATFMIYPHTGHGSTDPNVRLEIMEQNLDWFQKHLQQ